MRTMDVGNERKEIENNSHFRQLEAPAKAATFSLPHDDDDDQRQQPPPQTALCNTGTAPAHPHELSTTDTRFPSHCSGRLSCPPLVSTPPQLSRARDCTPTVAHGAHGLRRERGAEDSS